MMVMMLILCPLGEFNMELACFVYSHTDCLSTVCFRRRGTVIGNLYGPGTGQIWLDEVHCAGHETSIAMCPHTNWGVHNCDHSEDVAVLCGTSPVQYGK